jgi:hypothetical protein
MDDYNGYIPLVLGFVINVDFMRLPVVKAQLVECVRRLESDDRGYVFHPNNLEIMRNSGPVVASIANYEIPDDFDLEFAIKQTAAVLETQDTDTEKYVFVILDDYRESWEYGIKKAVSRGDCKFVFLGLGCDLPIFHRSQSITVYKSLTEHILNIAKIKGK